MRMFDWGKWQAHAPANKDAEKEDPNPGAHADTVLHLCGADRVARGALPGHRVVAHNREPRGVQALRRLRQRHWSCTSHTRPPLKTLKARFL